MGTEFGAAGIAGRQLCGLEYGVTWVRVWVKTGKKVYFKLQIHNLEPAERDSCKIAFVIFLTSIKKQMNVEMVAIPLACMCCSAPTMALSGQWRA